MQCKNCGAAIDADSKFCKQCGEKIEARPEPEPMPDEVVRMGEMIYSAYKHRDAKEYDDAIAACRAALAVNPSSAQANALLGSIYELQGDTASATTAYERAVVLDPTDTDLQTRLGRLRSSTRVSKPAYLAAVSGFLVKHRQRAVPVGIAGLAVLLVLVIGLHALRGPGSSREARRSPDGMAGVPQNAATVTPQVGQPQPSVGRIMPQDQRYPSQQDIQGTEPVAPSAQTAQVQQPQQTPIQAHRGVPPVPVPRTYQPNRSYQGNRYYPPSQGGTAQRPLAPSLIQSLQPMQPTIPAQQGGDQGDPAITPVIEPSQTGASQPQVYSTAPSPRPQASTQSGGGSVRVSKASDAIRPSNDPMSKAMQYQSADKYQDAVNAYRQSLGKSRDKAQVYQQMALSYQRLGQNGRAVESYRKAIQSYQEQLSAGRDRGEVQAGIRACEAGIQVSGSQMR